jgi:hypothetical protein
LLAIRALRSLRDQEAALLLGVRRWFALLTVTMTFGKVWVGALDLDKTLAADGLVAASGVVEVWRVVEEADGAFSALFVKEHFERLSIYKWIVRQVYLSRSKLCT